MEYSVLVVDDEHDQRAAIIERVDWQGAGFRVVGEAENGVEALDLVENLEPDLIITDIKMPMISGLELAKQVRELRPATQIVVLSGYDSFEYAKTAIDYNIIRYLLKPISSEEFSKELIEIHKCMDERLQNITKHIDSDTQNQLKKLYIYQFLLPLLLGSNESQTNEADLLSRAKELGIIEEGDDRFCIAVSKFKDAAGNYCTNESHTDFFYNIMSQYMHCETFLVYGRVISFIAINGDEEFSNALELPLREIVQTAKRVLKQKCTIGVSREFLSLAKCGDAYFEAINARRYTSDCAGEIRFINDQERCDGDRLNSVENQILELERILKVGKKESIAEFINNLYKNNTPEDVNLIVIQIIATIHKLVGLADKSELVALFASNSLFDRITSYSSENVIKNDLITLCENVKALITKTQKHESEVICDKVEQIIDERFSDEELSLTMVSNMICVSPNYLSTLIKKVKKKNFIALLTERRMKAAYDMLLCSQYRIHEISEKCGYSDQHYFSYCFKKFYGESPNKIRNSL